MSGTATPEAQTDTAVSKTTAAPAARPSRPSLKLGSSDYGRILFDGRGRALYLFTSDKGTNSRCYGACAAAWPPYLKKTAPTAGRGTRQSLLGTTRRRDGKRQVTYGGHPLYYYVGDRKAGQVLCQNVVEFGGTWLVVSGRGAAVS